ncbi:MAG: TonB-dependent receptor [Pseudomonadota bacterium]
MALTKFARLNSLWCASILAISTASAAQDTVANEDEASDNEEELVVETITVRGTLIEQTEGSGVGTRLNVPIENQPLSIQIIDNDIFNQIGASRLDDIIDFTVGGVQANQFGGNSENFLFRGFQSSVADDGILQNGVVAGNPRRRDPAAIERTEILRGPGSALFGQGGPGGVVNAVRKRPEAEEFFANYVIEGSSVARIRGELDVNVPVNDKVAVRLVTALEGGNSFRLQDAFDDTFTDNRQFVSPSILFTPTEQTTVLLRGEYLRTETPFDRGLLFTEDGDLIGDRNDFFGDPSVGPIINEDFSGFVEIAHAFNDSWSTRITGAVISNDFRGATTEPALLFPEEISLPGGANLGPLEIPEIIGGDTLLRSVESRNFENDVITGRIDLNGEFNTGFIKHNIIASFEYQNIEDFTFNSNSFVDFPPAILPDGSVTLDFNLISISNPVLEAGLPATFEGGVPSEANIDTFGLIFFDQIDIGDRIHILGGGRIDFVDQRTIFAADLEALEAGIGTVDEIDEVEFSPRVGIVVEPLRDTPLSAFFSWGESFEVNLPGEFDTSLIDPQEGRVFEGGLRYDVIPEQLRVTITGFDIEIDNIPILTELFGPQSSSTQSSSGVEFTAQGQIGDSITVLANYAFIDSDVISPMEDGSVGEGNAIPGVARNVASALVNYEFQTGVLEGLNFGVGLIYQDDRINSNPASFGNLLQPLIGGPDLLEFGAEELDSFVRLDLFGSYDFTEKFGVSFGIQNVTDELILQPSVPGVARPDAGINGFIRLRGRF